MALLLDNQKIPEDFFIKPGDYLLLYSKDFVGYYLEDGPYSWLSTEPISDKLMVLPNIFTTLALILYPQKPINPALVKKYSDYYPELDGVWNEELNRIQWIGKDFVETKIGFQLKGNFSNLLNCFLVTKLYINKTINLKTEEVSHFKDFNIAFRSVRTRLREIKSKFNIGEKTFNYELFNDKIYNISFNLYDTDGELIMDKIADDYFIKTIKLDDYLTLIFTKKIRDDGLIFLKVTDLDNYFEQEVTMYQNQIKVKFNIDDKAILLFDLKMALSLWEVFLKEKEPSQRKDLVGPDDKFVIFCFPANGFFKREPELNFKLLSFIWHWENPDNPDYSFIRLKNSETLNILYPTDYISPDFFIDQSEFYPKIDGYWDHLRKKIFMKVDNLKNWVYSNYIKYPNKYTIWKSLQVNKNMEVSLVELNHISVESDHILTEQSIFYKQTNLGLRKIIKRKFRYILYSQNTEIIEVKVPLKYYKNGQLMIDRTLKLKKGIKLEYTKEGEIYHAKFFIEDYIKLETFFSIDLLGTSLKNSILIQEEDEDDENENVYRLAALVDLRIAALFSFTD